MNFSQIIYELVFGFKTPHIVRVNNFKIGLIFRLVQLLILAYVIGVAIVYKKGYQDTDIAQSSVTTKVKGIASTLTRTDLPVEYRRIWDTTDYVIPPQENGAFFVMTNAILTAQQKFGKCPEDWRIAPCDGKPENCHADDIIPTGHGVMTGKCIPSLKNHSACEITGWCPVENDKPINPNEPLLPEVYNFTVLVKNSVEFPKFKFKKRNILDSYDDKYLQTCTFQDNADPSTCPVLVLGRIVEKSGANFTALALQGGVINIVIEWNCDLDYSREYCIPKFSFREMDNGQNPVAKGWNFRYANYYRDANGTLTRDLVKAYGIMFIFTLNGKAGKFNPVPLLLNIGAGLALLGIATIFCDFILLNCVKNREQYKDHKFLTVQEKTPNAAESGRPSISNVSVKLSPTRPTRRAKPGSPNENGNSNTTTSSKKGKVNV